MKNLLLCIFLLMPSSGIAINCETADVKLCNKAEQGDSSAQLLSGRTKFLPLFYSVINQSVRVPG